MKNKEDFMYTISKVKFYPLNPRKEDVILGDIAHALSHVSRAAGHFKYFYSIAQHSINCAIEAKSRGCSKRVQLACLLHDASESYLADIPRPVKKHLTRYYEIENDVQNVIFSAFGLEFLTELENDQWKEVDDALLYHEFVYFQETFLFPIEPYISLKPDFSQIPILSVKERFIDLCNTLTEQLSDENLANI